MMSRLEVVIVGAGIAGTLAAHVLREKHNVTIYELGSEGVEVGAALTVGPNGMHLLDSLGFSTDRAKTIPIEWMRTWHRDGTLLDDAPVYAKKKFGADWVTSHRVDLKNEFIRMATHPDGLGRPAKIVYDKAVLFVDAEKGIVTLDDDQEIKADLVIAADGIKSIVRHIVVGDRVFKTARPSGMSSFRFTMTKEQAQNSQTTKTGPAVFDREIGGSFNMVRPYDDSKRMAVVYPCRDYEILNFNCVVPDKTLKYPGSKVTWTEDGDIAEMLAIFHDFPVWLRDYMKAATNLKVWQLRDQDPLPTYIKGRTVLIGDAAHSMTPHQAQGGTQAIEDAEGFRLFNRSEVEVSRGTVLNILEEFDSVRRPRASKIQDNTRVAVGEIPMDEFLKMRDYNWEYPGVLEGLRRVQAGEELIQLPDYSKM